MVNKSITIPVDKTLLEGTLSIPDNAISLVIFSHGSGSSHRSPRNIAVSEILQRYGLATLLFELLDESESINPESRFDIDLLTHRLLAAINWLDENSMYKQLNPMLFGSSTGAASALRVASMLPDRIQAVVSRGGRSDLAEDVFSQIRVPTLFIVGELDFEILRLNRRALKYMTCETELSIIPGATHLFEEKGKLKMVAKIAAKWFLNHQFAVTKP